VLNSKQRSAKSISRATADPAELELTLAEAEALAEELFDSLSEGPDSLGIFDLASSA
jgi:hypothetical protein